MLLKWLGLAWASDWDNRELHCRFCKKKFRLMEESGQEVIRGREDGEFYHPCHYYDIPVLLVKRSERDVFDHLHI